MKPSVTFETKCYEKDWRFIINANQIGKMINNCNYAFDKKVLFINNVSDYNKVKKHADKLISKSIIDEYYVVEEYANEALNFFNLTVESFKQGYYYSIAELVSIYLCKTDYLLHFSGDSVIENKESTWIDDAITLMETDKNVFTANPVWNFNYEEAKNESFKEDDKWFYGFGFSDQSYLVKKENCRKPIYSEYNPASDRYPKYGGELFEKRVDSYMRNHNLYRVTSKHISYVHENIPQNIIKRFFKQYIS